MECEIVRKPFMLLETVEMLFRFVNGISFKGEMTRQKFLVGNEMPEWMHKRMEQLQQILEQACSGLDPQDPQLQRLFGRAAIEFEDVCVAQLMTYSFCTINTPGLRENAAEICSIWNESQEKGCHLKPGVLSTLVMSSEPGEYGDLFDQVCALPFPPDFQIKLYGALRCFEKTMGELVELMEVPAGRLEALYQQEHWLFDEMEQYWQDVFTRTTPAKLAREILGENMIPDAPAKTYVLPLLMKSNFVAFGVNALGEKPYNLLMIGSRATVSSRLRRNQNELDILSTILKALSDRRRLEILHRLSKGRSYCHELADAMAVDSGNMSRHLTLLHKYGFLRQERAPMVNYYETDKEALHDFLQLVENTICS